MFLGYLKVLLTTLTKQADSLPITSFLFPLASNQHFQQCVTPKNTTLAESALGASLEWLVTRDLEGMLGSYGFASSYRCLRVWPRSLLPWVSWFTLWCQRGVAWHPHAFPAKIIPAHIWQLRSVCFSCASPWGLWLLSASQDKAWRCIGSAGLGVPDHHGNFLLFMLKCLSQAAKERTSIPAIKTEATQVCHVNICPWSV